MFIIILKFANKTLAPDFMDGHNEWLRRGFADGVFFLAGSLKPGRGGVVLAQADDPESIERRVQEDPFVEHGVVSASVLEVAPGKVDERLRFLTD